MSIPQLVVVALAFAAMLGSSQEPAAPPARWTVKMLPSGCQATYGTETGREPLLSIVNKPLSGTSIVSATLPKAMSLSYGAPIDLMLQPSGIRLTGTAMGFRPDSGPVTLVALFVDTRQLLSAPVTMLHFAAGKKVLAEIDAPGMAEALALLPTCENSLLLRFGIDPGDVAPIAAFPKPLQDPGSWFRPQDYPVEARRAGAQGRVAGRFRVGEDGTVSDCAVVVSSGNASLDQGTCALLLKRARYRPATDADARPVASPQLFAMHWQLP